MRALLLALLFCLSGSLHASAFDHTHRQWSALLARHVTWIEQGVASEVDYPSFINNRPELEAYLTSLSNVPRAQYDTWASEQRLAFLINAYNAFTLKLVITHYPVESIKDIGGLFGNPWKQAFIPLLGQTLTLDQLEHSMIREPGVFDEPRIHFAVNCASVGCPALRNEAFIAARLDEQLEDSQKRFLSDPSRNRFDPTRQRFQVSKIFDWYGEDFAKRWGSLQAYLLQQTPFISDPQHAPTRESVLEVEFMDYDWSLNQSG